MIEEAAGTRMYESKKVSAQKTIGKKEAKLLEIQTVWQGGRKGGRQAGRQAGRMGGGREGGRKGGRREGRERGRREGREREDEEGCLVL